MKKSTSVDTEKYAAKITFEHRIMAAAVGGQRAFIGHRTFEKTPVVTNAGMLWNDLQNARGRSFRPMEMMCARDTLQVNRKSFIAYSCFPVVIVTELFDFMLRIQNCSTSIPALCE